MQCKDREACTLQALLLLHLLHRLKVRSSLCRSTESHTLLHKVLLPVAAPCLPQRRFAALAIVSVHLAGAQAGPEPPTAEYTLRPFSGPPCMQTLAQARHLRNSPVGCLIANLAICSTKIMKTLLFVLCASPSVGVAQPFTHR